MEVIEVAIGPIAGDGTLRVEVLRSSAGEASANVALDVDRLLTRRLELQQAVLASSVPKRALLSETERPLREVGATLFSALLGSRDIAGCYRASAALAAAQGQELRVVLRIDDPSLAALPWEAMYDDTLSVYLCRHEQLVRQVPVPSVAAPLAVRPPLRILGIASSPYGLPALDVEKEKKQLTRALSSLYDDGQIVVQWVPDATWAGLHDILLRQKWHVVHFIGHGGFDPDRDEGVLALVGEDGRYDLIEASRLVTLLGQAQPMPRLVVLNSCSGAVIGARDLFSSTAAALVRGGVSAVAAMQYEISDSAAAAFARGFYTAIASDRGVDEATSSGRVAIIGTGAKTLEWVTPVLYLRGSSSRLFALPSVEPGDGGLPRTPKAHVPGQGIDPATKNPPTTKRGRSKLPWPLIMRVMTVAGLLLLAAIVATVSAVYGSSHEGASGPHATTSSSVIPACPKGKASLQLFGSTAFMPIARDAAKAYMGYCHNASITVNPGVNDADSAFGLTKVCNAPASSAESMIAMFDGPSSSCPKLTPNLMGALILSVVVNTHLSYLFPRGDPAVSQLDEIFDKPGDQGYIAVGRRSGSGTRRAFFMDVLDQNPSTQMPDEGNCPPPTGRPFSNFRSCTEDSTQDLLNFVDKTPNAIGYAALAQPNAAYPNVFPLSINPDSSPSPGNVLNKSYKFWVIEHLYASAQLTTLAHDFLDFLPHYLEKYKSSDFVACSAALKKLPDGC